MLRSTAGKVAWLARATTTLVGLAILLALVFGVATTAMSATGGNFLLGKANGADRTSKLTASVAGPALRLVNQSTEAAATALNISVASGKAPIKVNAAAGTATYLSADELDGKDSADFYAAGSKVADSSHADQADSATNATNAQNAESATTADSATNADNAKLLDNKDSSAFQPSFKSTVVVSPVGTDSENGTALLDALSGITDASATNPYLLYIEPGTYDLGTGQLHMQEYVDIEGSGELQTTITSNVSGCPAQGTVVGADNAELRFLTVRNTGTGNCATAVRNESTSPRLTNVTVETISGTPESGNENTGVYNTTNANPTMTDVTINVSVGSDNTGGSDYITGITNVTSSPTMTDVTINVSAGRVLGPTTIGVYNTTNANPTMTDVTITASGDSNEALGVYNEVSSSATIRDSSLSGTTNSLLQWGGTSKIANTQLIGAVGKGDGATLQCVNNYNENMQPVTCP